MAKYTVMAISIILTQGEMCRRMALSTNANIYQKNTNSSWFGQRRHLHEILKDVCKNHCWFEFQVETLSLYIIRCMKESMENMEKKANGILPIVFFVWMKRFSHSICKNSDREEEYLGLHAPVG